MIDKIFNITKKITPLKWHWIFEHEGHKRYFANISWMFAGQMFTLLLSFFIGAWIARYLGPENYGVLNYSIAFVGIFGFISSLGIDSVLNRELIKTPEKRDEFLGTSFVLKSIGGVVAFSLVFLSIILFKIEPLIKLLVFLFSFSFLLQAVSVIFNYFNTKIESKKNVKVIFFATLISSVLKIILILFDLGIIWLVIIFVLDSLWQAIGFIIVYKNSNLNIKNWVFNKILAKEILQNSWPLMLASAAGFVYLKVDQVMIGLILDSHAVGIYAAAVKLVEIWYFIPVIISTGLLPAIINAKIIDEKLYKNRLKNFYILMTVIPVVMAIFVTIFAKPIVQILFGNWYLESVPILKIYIWSSVGIFLNYAMYQYLLSENFVKTIFWLNLFTMILNIILNLIFISIYGIIGSAFATLISYTVSPIFILIGGKFWKKIG